jgi:NADPH:quinone reductase
MRAAVCPAYGPPDVVRVQEQPSPAVAPGQVRVKVGAAAVNFPDILLIADQYQITVPPPFVPGSEFAGVIIETGEGAKAFALGDRVTGTGLYGAFA